MEKVTKINIDLFEGITEKEYNNKRAKYIANFTEYERGTVGFFSSTPGRHVPKPLQGEAKWNDLYPNGFEDWANKQHYLNASGEQKVINKINELIDIINSYEPKKTKTKTKKH